MSIQWRSRMPVNRIKDKTVNFQRLDEQPCSEWRPLTLDELRKLAPIKLERGPVKIDRFILALLLGERDRLGFVAEAARWLAESMIEAKIVDRPNFKNPSSLEKSLSALKTALRSLDNNPGEDPEGSMISANALVDLIEGIRAGEITPFPVSGD